MATLIQIGSFLVVLATPVSLKYRGTVIKAFIGKIRGSNYRIGKLDLAQISLLLLGTCYLGLMLILGTSSPFLIVRGTSMEPTYHAGDLLLAKNIAGTEIEVGAVVAFDIPAEAQERLRMPPTAAHRVLRIEADHGQLVFITKGDNSDVDPFKVPPDLVRGVVMKNLGPLARPILFLTNKTMLIFVGLPALTFAAILLAALWLTPKKSE